MHVCEHIIACLLHTQTLVHNDVKIYIAHTLMIIPIYAERMEAAKQGISQAKHRRTEKDKLIQELAKMKNEKKDTSAEQLARFFRGGSQTSIKNGKARLLLEDAVRRAEEILLQNKRAQKAAAVDSAEDKAKVMAEKMHHTPGSLLTEKELAHIYSELPECLDPRTRFNCRQRRFVEIRTADGTCNNLDRPTEGASFSAFKRLLSADYEDGISQPNGFFQSELPASVAPFQNNIGPFTGPFPSARLVSANIIEDVPGNDPRLTHLVMQWGQFIDHDIDYFVEISPEEAQCDIVNCISTDVCAPVRVPSNDRAFGVDQPRAGACLPFARTVPICDAPNGFEPRNHLNQITHYIDGSMIYGSTQERADFLREFSGGRLWVGRTFPETNGKPSLPEMPTTPPCLPIERIDLDFPPPERCCPEGQESCFIAGDTRVNEQVSLTVMHTIWVREHNRIADELAQLNPQWNDESIYQEARKIVIAEVQRITYDEFLPAILGPLFFDLLIGPYLGYIPELDASVPNSFATAAFRFGHSLIQDEFRRLGPNFRSIRQGPLPLREAFMNPQAYFDSDGTDPILRGLISQPARAVDEFLTSVLTTQLFEREEGMGMDLATLNIQRSRDHGIPPYTAWRDFCKGVFQNFLPEEFFQFSNDSTRINFLQTYESLKTIDLWIGGLAEKPIPGGVVGPTFACLFAITFRDLRDGDRFWYQNDEFTPSQLAQIERTSIAKIICDNSDNIPRVQLEAFFQGANVDCSLIPGIDFTPWIDAQRKL